MVGVGGLGNMSRFSPDKLAVDPQYSEQDIPADTQFWSEVVVQHLMEFPAADAGHFFLISDKTSSITSSSWTLWS
jgi:hypothetical protein